MLSDLRLPVCSVLSCTTWGLSCLLGRPWSGELLPRHFTLTPRQAQGGIISVTLAVSLEREPPLSQGMLPYGVRTFL